jgi:hypothetical protein
MVGASSFFLYFKYLSNPDASYMERAERAINEYCYDTKKFEEILEEARSNNEDEMVKFLEESRQKLVCTATRSGSEDPEEEPPVEGTTGGYDYFSSVFCDSESQMCTICWENDSGEKKCCRKSVEDNVPGRDKCTDKDPEVEPTAFN